MRLLLFLVFICFSNITLFAEGRSGEEIFKATCATCHIAGVANAPKAHDELAWKAKNKSIKELVESSKKGLNVMPPKGLCMDCTDKELEEAIEFMMQKEAAK